jgi:hypothetical protein
METRTYLSSNDTFDIKYFLSIFKTILHISTQIININVSATLQLHFIRYDLTTCFIRLSK